MEDQSRKDPAQVLRAIRQEAEERLKAFNEDPVPKIHVGMATCGIASGALETKRAFEEALRERSMEARIHKVGCLGHCYAEPVVIIENPMFPPIFYHQVTPGKARMLVRSFLEKGDPLFEYLMGAMKENEMIPQVWDFPRFSMEERIVMEKCGQVDPEEILEYVALGGYGGLVKALQTSPEAVVEEVKEAGLRGRGGAGQRPGAGKRPLSAMGTRGTPGPTWTGPFLRATPTRY